MKNRGYLIFKEVFWNIGRKYNIREESGDGMNQYIRRLSELEQKRSERLKTPVVIVTLTGSKSDITFVALVGLCYQIFRGKRK